MTETFFLLLGNLIPLYVLIGIGYIAGRAFDFEIKTLGGFAIYVCTPAVVFNYVAGLEFQPIYVALPIITFVLFSLLSFLWLAVASKIFPDSRANLLSICAVAGNTGYFGIPLVITFFDPHWVGVYIFAMVGGTLYEVTTMFYVLARGNFSIKDSLYKLIRLPTLYAILAGVAFNTAGFELTGNLATYLGHFTSAYIILGMTLIGVALSRTEKLVIGPRFLGLTFLGKFVIWPAFIVSMIMLDQQIFKLFSVEIHKIFYVFAIVPPAAGIVAYASELNVRPEKAATNILLGTIFALFYIPAMLIVFDNLIAQTP